MKLAILGSGAWGTALAVSFAPRHQVVLWSREAEEIEAMVRDRANQRFLPDVPLPAELEFSTSLSETLEGAELVIVAVPVAGLRSTLQQIVAHFPHPNPPPAGEGANEAQGATSKSSGCSAGSCGSTDDQMNHLPENIRQK